MKFLVILGLFLCSTAVFGSRLNPSFGSSLNPSKEVVRFLGEYSNLGKFLGDSSITSELRGEGLSPIQLAALVGLPELQSHGFLPSAEKQLSSLFDGITPEDLVVRKLVNLNEEKAQEEEVEFIYLKGFTPEDQVKAHLASLGKELDRDTKLWRIVSPNQIDVSRDNGALRGGTKLKFRQSDWNLYHVYFAVIDYAIHSGEYRVSVDFIRGIEFSTIRRIN